MDTITESAAASAISKPRRRWFQFSLRTLLIFTVLFSFLCAWIGNIYIHVHHQRKYVALIEGAGGKVYYDYQTYEGYVHIDNPPSGPALIRWLVGDDAFAHVSNVEFQDQPVVTDQDIASLSQLTELTSVWVSKTKLTDQALDHLAKCSKIKSLILEGTELNWKSLRKLQNLKHLSSLTLKGVRTNGNAVENIDALSHLTKLKLDLQDATSSSLAPISKLKNLEELRIFGGDQIDSGIFQYVGMLKRLRFLAIRSKSLSDDGLHLLSELDDLVILELEDTSISGKEIEYVLRLPKLTGLHFRNSLINDEAVAKIVKMKPLLPNLDLMNVAITDASMDAIASLHELTNLHLDHNKITDKGVKKLETLKKLKSLSIGPQISQETKEYLDEQLPECPVYLFPTD